MIHVIIQFNSNFCCLQGLGVSFVSHWFLGECATQGSFRGCYSHSSPFQQWSRGRRPQTSLTDRVQSIKIQILAFLSIDDLSTSLEDRSCRHLHTPVIQVSLYFLPRLTYAGISSTSEVSNIGSPRNTDASSHLSANLELTSIYRPSRVMQGLTLKGACMP